MYLNISTSLLELLRYTKHSIYFSSVAHDFREGHLLITIHSLSSKIRQWYGGNVPKKRPSILGQQSDINFE